MSIIQATVFREGDGLPLSATTDVDPRPEIKSCLKYVKLISKRLSKLTDRSVLHLEGYRIHIITSLGNSFLALCDGSYSNVLAFCFLEELQREFLVKYDRYKVDRLRRPYALIEFDMFLQKTRNRYNSPRTLSTKINLGDMSTEIKLRPPYVIKAGDLDLQENAKNGLDLFKPFKESYRPTLTPDRRFQPMNWVGMLSVVLDLFCAALNFTRGMTIINHGHYDEDDRGAYRFGSTFLLVAILYIVLLYMKFQYVTWRTAVTGFVLLLLTWSSYYLSSFRNFVQISFHIAVAIFSAVVIITRQLTEKIPGYSV